MTPSTTTISMQEARRKIEHFCAYQERCHDEVSAKLYAIGVRGHHAEELIAHLINNNYLNEERFARAFARGKHRIKDWGKSRIVRELKLRHISPANIKAALSEIEDEYSEAFDTIAEKVWNSLTETNLLKKKKKFCDQLVRKGFESDMVYNKMAELAGD